MATTAAQPSPDRPNIVVFYLDDTSAHDGRLWRDRELTPALAAHFVDRGIHMPNAIAETPLCCPARATLLTGLHTHNHGVTLNNGLNFDPAEHLGKGLQRAGYDTMIVGKYMNKVYQYTPAQWEEHERGWTFMDVFLNDQRLVPERYYANYDVRLKGGEVVHYGDYHSTRMVTERTIMRMREARADAPLFALLSVFATHPPNIPMPEFASDERCNSMPPWNPPNYNEADISDKPAYVQRFGLLSQTAGWPLEQFCRQVLGIDWMVEQVTAELTAQGRLDNTLLVFTADNGMTWGEHRLPPNKHTPYATPVPLYMSWPARWGSDARTIPEHVSNIDLAPTFCAVGGCALGPFPGGRPGPDGVSLLPLLDGSTENLGRDALLESSFQVPWWGVRTTALHALGLWHYVEWSNGDRELYDLGVDPFEMENVASDSELRDVRDALALRLRELRSEGASEPPTPGRPDASIAKSADSPQKRIHFYRSTPVRKQTVWRSDLRPGRSYEYLLRVANDGAGTDSIAVQSVSSGADSISFAYFSGSADLSSEVKGGSYQVTLAPGSAVTLVIRVTVGKATPLDASGRAVVTVRSLSDPSQVDVVRAIAVR